MSIFKTIRTWNRVRQTRNELSGLPNHMLDDLGICRGDISTVARNAARR